MSRNPNIQPAEQTVEPTDYDRLQFEHDKLENQCLLLDKAMNYHRIQAAVLVKKGRHALAGLHQEEMTRLLPDLKEKRRDFFELKNQLSDMMHRAMSHLTDGGAEG